MKRIISLVIICTVLSSFAIFSTPNISAIDIFGATTCFPVLPSVVDHTSHVPAPGNQSGSGAGAAAWAVGYSLKSFHEDRENGWGFQTDRTKFSPVFIQKRLQEKGQAATLSYSLQLVVDEGVCSLKTMPCATIPSNTTDAQKAEAECYRADSYIEMRHESFNYGISVIETMKRRLYNGDCLVTNINYFSDFAISTSNPVYDDIGTGETENAIRHAFCIIGYDDTKNAFKFVNSWGTSWGLGGYGYISYDIMTDVRTDAFTYALNDKIGKGVYTFRNANSGMYLTINPSTGATTQTQLISNALYTMPDNQKFFINTINEITKIKSCNIASSIGSQVALLPDTDRDGAFQIMNTSGQVLQATSLYAGAAVTWGTNLDKENEWWYLCPVFYKEGDVNLSNGVDNADYSAARKHYLGDIYIETDYKRYLAKIINVGEVCTNEIINNVDVARIRNIYIGTY